MPPIDTRCQGQKGPINKEIFDSLKQRKLIIVLGHVRGMYMRVSEEYQYHKPYESMIRI